MKKMDIEKQLNTNAGAKSPVNAGDIAGAGAFYLIGGPAGLGLYAFYQFLTEYPHF